QEIAVSLVEKRRVPGRTGFPKPLEQGDRLRVGVDRGARISFLQKTASEVLGVRLFDTKRRRRQRQRVEKIDRLPAALLCEGPVPEAAEQVGKIVTELRQLEPVLAVGRVGLDQR